MRIVGQARRLRDLGCPDRADAGTARKHHRALASDREFRPDRRSTSAGTPNPRCAPSRSRAARARRPASSSRDSPSATSSGVRSRTPPCPALSAISLSASSHTLRHSAAESSHDHYAPRIVQVPAQIVTWVPTSTTRPVGMWKKSVASLADLGQRDEQPVLPARHAECAAGLSSRRDRKNDVDMMSNCQPSLRAIASACGHVRRLHEAEAQLDTGERLADGLDAHALVALERAAYRWS